MLMNTCTCKKLPTLNYLSFKDVLILIIIIIICDRPHCRAISFIYFSDNYAIVLYYKCVFCDQLLKRSHSIVYTRTIRKKWRKWKKHTELLQSSGSASNQSALCLYRLSTGYSYNQICSTAPTAGALDKNWLGRGNSSLLGFSCE